MTLAYARLAERDRPAAERAVADAVSREPEGTFTIARGPWADDPGFLRAVALIQQGDAKLARGELDKLGVGARTAPRELTWASAFLLARGRGDGLAWIHALGDEQQRGARERARRLARSLPGGPLARSLGGGLSAPLRRRRGRRVQALRPPEAWAYAIMREESAFDPRVVSPAKAFGLMQLIIPTAKKMAEPLSLPWDEEALKRPEVNVAVGCRYLTILRNQFPTTPSSPSPATTRGGGAPKRWVGERPGTTSTSGWSASLTRRRGCTPSASSPAWLPTSSSYTRSTPSEALRSPLAASPAAKMASTSSP